MTGFDWGAAMQLADKLLERGGPLGVLVLCVGMFLIFLWSYVSADAKLETQRNESLERMGNACHTAQLETMDRVDVVFDRTLKALDRNTEAFGRVAGALDRMGIMATPREPKDKEEPDEPPG